MPSDFLTGFLTGLTHSASSQIKESRERKRKKEALPAELAQALVLRGYTPKEGYNLPPQAADVAKIMQQFELPQETQKTTGVRNWEQVNKLNFYKSLQDNPLNWTDPEAQAIATALEQDLMGEFGFRQKDVEQLRSQIRKSSETKKDFNVFDWVKKQFSKQKPQESKQLFPGFDNAEDQETVNAVVDKYRTYIEQYLKQNPRK